MRYRDLNEAASDPLPNKFWLVFDIPTYTSSDERHQSRIDRLLSDIAAGELHGVKGISATREIITNWFMIARNAAVVMNPQQVADLNDIEQVRYDDPDWLCQNNFAALYRIWDKTGGGKYRHSSMMYNLAAYVVKALTNVTHEFHTLEYHGAATKLGDQWQKIEDSANINSLDDAARLFETMMKEIAQEYYWARDINDIDWRAGLKGALKRVSKVYSSEGEWLVSSPAFRIPPKSIMLIAVHKGMLDQYAEWQQSKDDFKWYAAKSGFEQHERLLHYIDSTNMRERYDIRFIDGKKFEAMRPNVDARRSKLKEAFDGVQRFSWVDNSNEDMSLLQASFQMDDGLFVVQFKNLYYNPGYWEMSFVRNGELKLTNTGSAQKVLATVMDAARQFIAAKHPRQLALAAKNDEVSRTKLYPKLIAMMQRDFPQYVGDAPKKMRSHTEYRFRLGEPKS